MAPRHILLKRVLAPSLDGPPQENRQVHRLRRSHCRGAETAACSVQGQSPSASGYAGHTRGSALERRQEWLCGSLVMAPGGNLGCITSGVHPTSFPAGWVCPSDQETVSEGEGCTWPEPNLGREGILIRHHLPVWGQNGTARKAAPASQGSQLLTEEMEEGCKEGENGQKVEFDELGTPRSGKRWSFATSALSHTVLGCSGPERRWYMKDGLL